MHTRILAWVRAYPRTGAGPRHPKEPVITVPPQRKIGTERGSSHGFWL